MTTPVNVRTVGGGGGKRKEARLLSQDSEKKGRITSPKVEHYPARGDSRADIGLNSSRQGTEVVTHRGKEEKKEWRLSLGMHISFLLPIS